jgi:agmatinase
MTELQTDFPEHNPDDPTKDAWRIAREDLQGDRPPDLIHLNRFPFATGASGIATFLQRPVALTPADLRAAEVDVALVGAGVDTSVGMRGSGFGPRALRSHDMYLPGMATGFPHLHTRVDAMEELVVADYGDAPVDPESSYRSIEPIRGVVREIAKAGTMPVRDRWRPLAHVPRRRGADRHLRQGRIGVVHFDAHFDGLSVFIGHNHSHGTPVRRLIEQGHVSGHNFIQVGLRGYAIPSDEDLAWMRDQGFWYHFMAEVEKHGWDHVMERAIAEAADGTDYLGVSLDIDVLDPAYAPGTGTPEPNGLTPRELFPLLRHLGAETNLVGLELVELNPLVNPTYVTPLVANRCVRELLTGISPCARRASPNPTTWPQKPPTTARAETGRKGRTGLRCVERSLTTQRVGWWLRTGSPAGSSPPSAGPCPATLDEAQSGQGSVAISSLRDCAPLPRGQCFASGAPTSALPLLCRSRP